MPKQPFADFELPGTSNTKFKFSEQRGHPVVIYFYPKDNTPGCTTEGQNFRDLYPQFRKAKCAIFGVSRDSVKSHEGFKAKMQFPFELLSDAEETASKLFGVIKMKNLYGRQVRGIERSTFAFDASGQLAREWRGLKVPGHAQEVLEFVKSLKS
jgi:peroxiredoxin Q/BCP